MDLDSSSLCWDSGYYDNPLPVPTPLASSIMRLKEWQEDFLRNWILNNCRLPNDHEIRNFCSLFQVEKAVLSTRLFQICRDQTGSSAYESTSAFLNTVNSQEAFREINNGVYHESSDNFMQNTPKVTGYNSGNAFNIPEQPAQSMQHYQLNIEPEPCDPLFAYLPDHNTVLATEVQYPHWCNTTSTYVAVTPLYQTREEPLLDRVALHDQQHTDPRHDYVAHSTDFENALKTRVKKEAIARKEKGCGIFRGSEERPGKFPCTLGCGRSFRSHCDVFRHEEIAYPQQFYYCSTDGCRHLCSRKDKLNEHIRKCHSESTSVGSFKVRNFTGLFPQTCELCLHHTHRSWRGRRDHIIAHFKRGHCNRSPWRRAAAAMEDLGNESDDDDEEKQHGNTDDGNDKNGRDDDQDDRDPEYGPDDDDNDEDGSNSPPPNDQLTGHNQQDGPDVLGTNEGSSADHDIWGPDLFLWNSEKSQRVYRICVVPLRLVAESTATQRPPLEVPVTSLGRVNGKGGTASVFKVKIPMDLETGNSSGLVTYAVKQYSAAHQHSFKREVNALSILQTQDTAAASVVRCYGTFEHRYRSGEITYNLILEYAECDLSTYWARNPWPHDARLLEQFWASLLRIMEAVSRIHDAILPGSMLYYGVHGDLKPDNILWFGDTLKLADFGFATFLNAHNKFSGSDLRVIGGTTAYGAPELTNHAYAHSSFRLTQKADVWSLGCVLSEAVTWSVLGTCGLQAFRKRRQYIKGIPHFHDGKGVLSEVLGWHEYLRHKLWKNRILCWNVLNIVDNHVLQEDPAQRWSAQEISFHLRLTVTVRKDGMERQSGLTQMEGNTSLGLVCTQHTELSGYDNRASKPPIWEKLHVVRLADYRYCTLPALVFFSSGTSILHSCTNVRGSREQTPLMSAVWFRYMDTVEILLSTGKVHRNAKDNEEQASLGRAAGLRHRGIVGSPLMDSSQAMAKPSQEKTPLMRAAWHRQKNMIELLLGTCPSGNNGEEQTTGTQVARIVYRDTAFWSWKHENNGQEQKGEKSLEFAAQRRHEDGCEMNHDLTNAHMMESETEIPTLLSLAQRQNPNMQRSCYTHSQYPCFREGQ